MFVMNICRYCLEDNNEKLLYPCACKGSGVHLSCLERWIKESRRTECEICHSKWRGLGVKWSGLCVKCGFGVNVAIKMTYDVLFWIFVFCMEGFLLTTWFVLCYYYTMSLRSLSYWCIFHIVLYCWGLIYRDMTVSFVRLMIYDTFTLFNIFNHIAFVYDCTQSEVCPLQELYSTLLYQWYGIIFIMLVSLVSLWQKVE